MVFGPGINEILKHLQLFFLCIGDIEEKEGGELKEKLGADQRELLQLPSRTLLRPSGRLRELNAEPLGYFSKQASASWPEKLGGPSFGKARKN